MSPCDLRFTQIRVDTPEKVGRTFKVYIDPVKVSVNKRSVKLCGKVVKELTRREPRKRKVRARRVKLSRVPRSAHSSPRTLSDTKSAELDHQSLHKMSQSSVIQPLVRKRGHSRARSVGTSLSRASTPRSQSVASTPNLRSRRKIPQVCSIICAIEFIVYALLAF